MRRALDLAEVNLRRVLPILIITLLETAVSWHRLSGPNSDGRDEALAVLFSVGAVAMLALVVTVLVQRRASR